MIMMFMSYMVGIEYARDKKRAVTMRLVKAPVSPIKEISIRKSIA